jgi:hypothetical protein
MYSLPYFHNERDVEIPLLVEWLEKNDCQLGSVLDVGYRQNHYAPFAQISSGYLMGIDLIPDPSLYQFYDELVHEDFLYADLPKVDWVFSISTIEHIGVEYSPTLLYRDLQLFSLEKMVKLANMGVFLTLPYGEGILFSGKYLQWGHRELEEAKAILKGTKYQTKFYSTPDPKEPGGWREVRKDLADKSTGDLSKGVDTIAVLEVYK